MKFHNLDISGGWYIFHQLLTMIKRFWEALNQPNISFMFSTSTWLPASLFDWFLQTGHCYWSLLLIRIDVWFSGRLNLDPQRKTNTGGIQCKYLPVFSTEDEFFRHTNWPERKILYSSSSRKFSKEKAKMLVIKSSNINSLKSSFLIISGCRECTTI